MILITSVFQCISRLSTIIHLSLGDNSIYNVFVRRGGLDAAVAHGGGVGRGRARAQPVVSARDGRVRHGAGVWAGIPSYTSYFNMDYLMEYVVNNSLFV